MKNWKTTLIGVLTAALYAYAQNAAANPKQLSVAIGIAALGVLARDFNTTPKPALEAAKGQSEQ